MSTCFTDPSKTKHDTNKKKKTQKTKQNRLMITSLTLQNLQSTYPFEKTYTCNSKIVSQTHKTHNYYIPFLLCKMCAQQLCR